MKTLKFETKINKAKTTGKSLKTTIPITLINLLGLENGSILEWTCKIKDNKVIVCVEPSTAKSK